MIVLLGLLEYPAELADFQEFVHAIQNDLHQLSGERRARLDDIARRREPMRLQASLEGNAGSLPRLSHGMGSVGLSNQGLEREINFFNRLEGSVCATCAPGDQENLATAKVSRLSEDRDQPRQSEQKEQDKDQSSGKQNSQTVGQGRGERDRRDSPSKRRRRARRTRARQPAPTPGHAMHLPVKP
ncbi:hypothetical protein [Bradyrhizobium sp. 143]|uniref:hypothetical protein n=1 Tax=Bradyrhizobium sp. 143 TaxID=2782619 RepID=UPI001FFA4E27|nr:hypothetical protein [Bradyrhizobium sp. 143]MCK1711453.1 hypothetical protein [Bradyrhizobium sp. 143]MCK1726858.1 hypothetical protein [Bradyrhizobium sp. 142]